MGLFDKKEKFEIQIDDVTIEDMPNDIFKEIATTCGLETATKLLANWGGTKIDVPLEGFKKIKMKIIKREFDGTTLSIKNLARTLKMSENEVRKTLKQQNITIPATGQINLFTGDTDD